MSNNNSTKNWILGILGFVLVWHIIGYFSLASQNEGLDGYEGGVWNMVERANELLPRLENDYAVFEANRQLFITKIVDGRTVEVPVRDELSQGSAELQAAYDAKDLQLAQQAMARLQPAINVIVENYPSMGLEQVQVALIDETAGSVNRVAYARGELIKAQTSFNKTRVYYPLLGGMFSRVDVLGANTDPTTGIQPSTLVTPQP